MSNKAIDAIAEKFAHRLPFIVVGQDERVGPTARQWTLEAQVGQDPDVMFWHAAKKELSEHIKTFELDQDDPSARQEATAANIIEKLEHSSNAACRRCATATCRRVGQGRLFLVLSPILAEGLKHSEEENAKNRRRASLAIRRSCRAVLTTIDSCGSAVRMLDSDRNGDRAEAEVSCIAERLSLAVLDEAGTIPEAKVCVIIATLPQVTRIVAIGDQQQLEPYTDIQRQHHHDVPTQGYFHRAVRVLSDEVPMLQTQFRMHPQICQLVSSIAYAGQLRTDPVVAAQRKLESGEPGERVISWVDYDMGGTGESRSARFSSSWQNEQEAKLVCDLAITELGILQPKKKRLLIITFYRQQLKLLRDELADVGVLKRDKNQGCPSTLTTATCASRRSTRRKDRKLTA